ncbi:MAG: hypothetical protein R2731_00085 [Nocardioides sp.]
MNDSKIDNSGARYNVRVDTAEYANDADDPLDEPWRQGRVAEETIAEPDGTDWGAWLTRTYHRYDNFVTGVNAWDQKSRIVVEDLTRYHTKVSDGPDQEQTVTRSFDEGGTSHQRPEAGMVQLEMNSGWSSGSADNRCTVTSWATNTAEWIALPKTQSTYRVNCAPPGLSTSNEVLEGRVTHVYDNGAAGGPTKGLETETRAHTSATAYLATATEYDGYGNVKKVTDPYGAVTTTSYNPGTPSAPTGVLAQPGADQDVIWAVTTTTGEPSRTPLTGTTAFDIRHGVPTEVIDANNTSTRMSYDGFGRLRTVRKPGVTGAQTPNLEFVYAQHADSPSKVTTITRRTGADTDTSYTYLDGWGRVVETQIPQIDGSGRVVAATEYNDRGLVVYQMPAVRNADDAGSGLLNPNRDNTNIERYTWTRYDAANRVTRVDTWHAGENLTTATTTYTGDAVITVPPNPSGATRAEVNGYGQTTRVEQYTSRTTDAATPVHAANYTYTATGALTTITSTVNGQSATWAYGYDLAGRQITASDPDTGYTTTVYNDDPNAPINTGLRHSVQVRTYKDQAAANGGQGAITNLTTSYDAFGRPSKVTDAGGAEVSSWVYGDDPGAPAVNYAKGRLVSTSSRVDVPALGNAVGVVGVFSTSVDAYDGKGNPLSATYTYPTRFTDPTAGADAKASYKVTSTYNDLGQPTQTSYPAVADLPATVINTSYGRNDSF